MIDDPQTAGDHGQQDLRTRLLASVQLQVGQQRILWQLCGTFWVANAGLVIALFASGDVPRPLVGVSVSAAGLLLAAACWLLVRQAAARVQRSDALIGRIERRLGVATDLTLGSEAPEGLGVGGLIGLATAGAGVLWLVALALFAYSGLAGVTEAPVTF